MLPMMLPPPHIPEGSQRTRSVAQAGAKTPRSIQAVTFVDIETTGLDRTRHEIVEVAAIRVDLHTLDIQSEYQTRVAPEHLDTADAEALSVCGFSSEAWQGAGTLRDALLSMDPLLDGALVAGHNVTFDWGFLEVGFRRAGLLLPRVDYHRLDTASLAWPLFATGEVASLSLDTLAQHFGLLRPRPHRALADARLALELARRLRERMTCGAGVAALEADERQIIDALLARLQMGRSQYGNWKVVDGRNYPSEAYAEMLDGMHYLAAELVKLRRLERERRRRVYVCHPYADDPRGNTEVVRRISRRLIAEGVVPLAPHLYLPQLLNETTDRELALALCLELLATCDEVRVYGNVVTNGMERELREAKRLGLRAHFVREVLS